MGGYRFVLVKPAARPAYPLFGVLPLPATVPIQALLALGALLIVLIALAAYSDMLKPGLQAASRLHPYTPSALSSDKPQSLRRARPAASTSSSRASSTSRARLSNPKYKGLRNTGNTCFFNSTLQSISSLSLYRKYLYFLVQQAERWDTPTPVIDALLELVEELATPGDRNAAINPVHLVRALQNLPSSSIRSLVGAHQQQDAHELFALLNEAVDSEAKAIQHERSSALDTEQAGLRALMAPSLSWSGRGIYADPAHAQTKQAINGTSNPLQVLGMAPHDGSASASADAPTASSDDMLVISPFDALLAQRTICLDCGYCEAIRHFSTSEISLSVPALNVRTRTSDITGTSACSLQECLALWSDLEQVDWICWNCTLRNTLQAVQADIASKGPAPVAAKPNGAAANGDAHASANGSSLTPAKKKRFAQLRSKEAKLNRILQSGLSEDELRQASEDAASPWHNVLNNIQLKKTISRLSTKQIMISRPPRILALHLNRSSYSASSWAPSKNNRHVLFPEYLDLADFTLQGSISLDGRLAMNSSSAHSLSDAEREGTADSIYRLSAIVVHYGSHSFGHYIAFKRISADEGGCDAIADAGEADADGWLRISDESVTRATIQQVKQENPYMLFYELMPSRAHVLQQHGKMELSDGGADYATLQRAIAGAMAAQGHGQMQDEVDDAAGSARASPAPGSLRIRPRTVHRWSTPPVA
ncbi:related to UBP1-ubiquitin-specific protease [Sporisorium reilianum SRZ2]|uniref:Ubiquitin carboxyl-terminal hydrolase n=1 Tax=Sporisorium reilianum (strain SRZ2) TaxID=999809 RepID=E6ZUU1_SPORE|nr:related to UBP1-ubiquitin-specific protease [Sporisorium reilianum SRZ2]